MKNKKILATLALANMRLHDDANCDQIWTFKRLYMQSTANESVLFVRNHPGLALMPTQTDVERAEKSRDSIVILPWHSDNPLTYMATEGGDGSEILRSTFSTMTEEMQDFLAKSRESGRPPFEVLDKKFRQLSSKLPLALYEEGSRVSIGFTNMPAPLGYIEDYVDYYLYLLPALNGEFEVWRKNRVCPECGNIFFYKLDRAKFCSTACQMRQAYKRRNGKMSG